MTTDEFTFRPACRADRAGGCSDCTMAYDCQSKAQGRPPALFVLALALLAAGLLSMAL